MRFEDIKDELLRRIPEFTETYKNLDKQGAFNPETIREGLLTAARDSGLNPSSIGSIDYADLPTYILVSEFLTFVAEGVRRGPPQQSAVADEDLLGRTAAFLEDALASGDPKVENVLQLQFFENLWTAGTGYKVILSHLGPRSRRLLTKAESW